MTKPPVPRLLRCRALLFDLDGTLIDSLPAVDRAWTTFCIRHGLDPDEVLPQIHGRRSIDSIRRMLPNLDAEAEDAYIRHLESSDTTGVTPLPGALDLLSALPPERWAVVTSGTSDVARARMAAAGIPPPEACVFGEDVMRGKPAPDPFLLAAKRLGFAPADCVGFEDTMAGVLSVEAAGMAAVPIRVAERSSIRDLRQVRVEADGDELLVHIGYDSEG